MTFVDKGAAALDLLKRNVARLRVEAETAILARDATRPGANPGAPADLAFLDPPYGKGLGERAMAAIRGQGWLAPGALVIWEESAPLGCSPGLTLLDARRYGDTMISILSAP